MSITETASFDSICVFSNRLAIDSSKRSFLFKKAISFNQPIKVWNVGSVTNMSSMFNSATSFNQTINSWDVRNVTNMANMFQYAISFNMPLNEWVPFSVQSMEAMFKNALTFDQNIGSWNIKNITTCAEMFNGVTLSNANYEGLLIGWNNQDLNQNIVFDGGNSNYFSNESVAAKHNMITNDNWTITDGGKKQQVFWTGANSTDWNDPENWDINRVPTQHENVVLADVENAPIINTDENHTVNKLINDENLSISTNASLTVLGDINQKNTISISSSYNANGSLIVKGNQISLNPADVIYERFVSGNEWHLISSPVTDFNIDTFVADSPLNEEEQGNVKSLGFYDNHANPNWSYYKVDDNPGNFISGKGYSVNTSIKTLLTFRGKLMSENLSKHKITENFSGWNLVGNPYTAFINLNTAANENDNFLEKNAENFDPAFATIYLWNPNTTSYEPVGNGLGAKHIAPGQGFFVKSKNAVGEINITKSMLSHQSGNLFLKDIQPENIVLQISDNIATSETTIAFKEGMTKSLDLSYDAAVFNGESKNLSIYSHLIEDNDDISFAIQFLPELDKYNSIVPIGISQNGFNEITLSLKDSNISPSAYIYLEDKVENTFTEISTSTNYKFHLRTEAPETGRFFLHFQANPLSANEFDTSKINIYKDNNNALQIKGISKGLLNMYSITGQQILKNKKINSNSTTIQIPKIATGVYLLKINFEGKEYVQKILF